MKAIIILSVICFILFLGLLLCIVSIYDLRKAFKLILETMKDYDKLLGLEI